MSIRIHSQITMNSFAYKGFEVNFRIIESKSHGIFGRSRFLSQNKVIDLSAVSMFSSRVEQAFTLYFAI